MTVVGLLLAAGAGRRMGRPKALLRDAHGVPFLGRAVGALLDGGCASVVVVLGAEEVAGRAVLAETGWAEDPAVAVVVAGGWASGMGASLRAGLEAVPGDADLAAVSLVDLPDVSSAVVERTLSVAAGPGTLARASYGGRPGHPVLLGRDHWAGVVASAGGDRGARDYLAAHAPVAVECGDLATGRDVDHPSDLETPASRPDDR